MRTRAFDDSRVHDGSERVEIWSRYAIGDVVTDGPVRNAPMTACENARADKPTGRGGEGGMKRCTRG